MGIDAFIFPRIEHAFSNGPNHTFTLPAVLQAAVLELVMVLKLVQDYWLRLVERLLRLVRCVMWLKVPLSLLK